MKDHVQRAMQISTLELDQLSRVHEIEKRKGYLLPNWEIQEMFGLPTLKDRYGILDDAENQVNHNRRIELEIERLQLRSTPPYEDRFQWWHLFDNKVFDFKDQMVWDFSGSTSKRGNIKERLRGNVE